MWDTEIMYANVWKWFFSVQGTFQWMFGKNAEIVFIESYIDKVLCSKNWSSTKSMSEYSFHIFGLCDLLRIGNVYPWTVWIAVFVFQL